MADKYQAYYFPVELYYIGYSQKALDKRNQGKAKIFC